MPHREPPDLATPLSPATFAPLDGLPGVCALARDEHFRQLWCNTLYAKLHDTTPEAMVGKTLWDVLPKALADERAGLMRPALEGSATVVYVQVWRGGRWFTRVAPLDESAFGVRGYFVILTRIAGSAPGPDRAIEEAPVLVRSADVGRLAALSAREFEVFYHLATGLSVKEVAEVLYRSPKTIGRHAEAIHEKLGFSTRAEIVRYAAEHGLTAFTPQEWERLRIGGRTDE
jgi:DNA-binding CsgD family transcriptional regulator